MMHILIVTDAWFPQVNGVVRTLDMLCQHVRQIGHRVTVISPDLFRSIPCPTYPEIRLAWTLNGHLGRMIEAARPCAIHLATEGPLGWAARHYCLRRNIPFTTAYHSRFPEYIRARLRIPLALSYAVMRFFHRPSSRVMVATASMEAELQRHGLRNMVRWSRGVDSTVFHPRPHCRDDRGPLSHCPRPIFLNVGRVAVEKNIRAFLDLDLPGSKVVVGDGPQKAELMQAYPEVLFLGAKHGQDLACLYAASDVFVFPSVTDTFGLVMLEALASGLPVAAFPVPGPLDIVQDKAGGCLHSDLRQACLHAASVPSAAALEVAARFSWAASARQFLDNLHPFPPP